MERPLDKETYRYWKMRIWLSLFIGYAFYYFTRKSFVYAMPGLIEELGFDKAQLGIMSTLFAVSYGASKFFSGILSDKSNPRYFMAFGLLSRELSQYSSAFPLQFFCLPSFGR